MGKIKDKGHKKDSVSRAPLPNVPYIAFSFKYLTSNNTYGVEYFRQDRNNGYKMHVSLIKWMEEVCCMTIAEVRSRAKSSGGEQIPCRALDDRVRHICKSTGIITDDSVLTVFRFCNQKYRILCKSDVVHSNLLYVLAFDFDYSAYNH